MKWAFMSSNINLIGRLFCKGFGIVKMLGIKGEKEDWGKFFPFFHQLPMGELVMRLIVPTCVAM
jgi:hypothetical protein